MAEVEKDLLLALVDARLLLLSIYINEIINNLSQYFLYYFYFSNK